MAGVYRVRVVKGDLQFEAEGDKKFVLDMLKRFEDAPLSVVAAKEPASKRSAPTSAKPVSIGEFIRQLGLKKHVDFVLAFGYYLEKTDGLAAFSAGDINRCYYDAKLEPSNTSQAVTSNIQAGRIMPAKDAKGAEPAKKKYTLTQSGESKVAQWMAAQSNKT